MGPKGIAKAVRTIARYPGALTTFCVVVHNTSEMIRRDKELLRKYTQSDDPAQRNESRWAYEESMVDLENAIAICVMEGYSIPTDALDAGALATAIVDREWCDWLETDPVSLHAGPVA